MVYYSTRTRTVHLYKCICTVPYSMSIVYDLFSGGMWSSSPTLPLNEVKPQWTTLSLRPCTSRMLREVYASLPSLLTSLGTRYVTTCVFFVVVFFNIKYNVGTGPSLWSEICHITRNVKQHDRIQNSLDETWHCIFHW